MKNTDKLAQGISRRDFIKGAAAGAVGLAAAGMLGLCFGQRCENPGGFISACQQRRLNRRHDGTEEMVV